MIECKENEEIQEIQEEKEEFDYMNEAPFEEEVSDDEEPDYCD